jgi:AraC-like DNA-binding protein
VENLIRTFGLKQELRHPGPPPEELFNTVINSLCNIDASEAIRASVAAYDILLRAVNPISRSDSSQDIVERFKMLVAQNYSIPEFSLQTAATSLGVHRSTLHRVFSAKSGISPQDYLISYRLQQALEMLDNNVNIHIKEVAAACGFNAQHYFAKVFRKYFGKNPNEFRKDLIYSDMLPGKRITGIEKNS